MEKQYGERKTGETLLMWIARLEKNNHNFGFNKLLKLYYRHRYDPAGLQPDEENELNSQAVSLLAKMNTWKTGDYVTDQQLQIPDTLPQSP